MRALCVSLRAVLFLSIHVVHRRERPGYAGDWRPAFTHLNETTNSAEPRIHLTHNYMPFHSEWALQSGHSVSTVILFKKKNLKSVKSAAVPSRKISTSRLISLPPQRRRGMKTIFCLWGPWRKRFESESHGQIQGTFRRTSDEWISARGCLAGKRGFFSSSNNPWKDHVRGKLHPWGTNRHLTTRQEEVSEHT